MQIDNSSLWREVQSIVSSGEKPVHFAWDLVIHANGEAIRPMKIVSIDFNRDYLNNYADAILVSVIIPLGTYAKRVYPYLNNLDIELTRRSIGETDNAWDTDAVSITERYTATPIDTGNPIVESDIGTVTSEDDLNRYDFAPLMFQLTNKLLEQLRGIVVGRIFRDMTGEEVVKAMFMQAASTAKVDDGRKLKGVDMVPASNREKRTQIIVPQNTKLMELPHQVHYHGGGLYASGLGYYLQDNYMYLFPCYDTTRFKSGKPTLTIINIPPRRLPGIERTYRKDGDNLVVIATGDTKFSELSNVAQLNDGNGVRFADASNMMDRFVTVKGNKAIAQRGVNNTEVVTDERPNGVNFVSTALRQINANPFVEFSALASRQGSGINLVWENADVTLLYPGMSTKVMYLDGDDIKELQGVLLGGHEYTSMRDQGYTATRYVSVVTLSVFVKPLEEEETATA